MNILIKNQNYKITDTLNVDIIKTLTGEFELEDVQKELVNFYYNKVIIDITAIKNNYNISSVLTFLKGFESSKVILLLNDSQLVNSESYLKALIENGYYNFTRNSAGINYLIDNPNEYNDVKKYIQKKEINELNETTEVENRLKIRNPSQKIIGVQNLTEHAGATTLCYLMYKELIINYNAKLIEMNKQDLIYFKDITPDYCTSVDDLNLKLKEYSDVEVILIDLNTFESKDLLDEILYIIEPGTVKINKLIKKDRNYALKASEGKIILNRSNLRETEIPNFEYETKLKIFKTIPNLNDRDVRDKDINLLLSKLGFEKQTPKESGLLKNIFKK